MVGKFQLFLMILAVLYHINLFFRYIDDIFITSNASLGSVNGMLDIANNLHSNIKLVQQIGTSVSFLNLFIENKNGVLATFVYQKEAAEPYLWFHLVLIILGMFLPVLLMVL
jgi:hypothetical protein